jgi:tetratricopeptide (TPR) repeat protein
MRSRLNVRFLILFSVCVSVFAVGWFLTHRFQKKRRLNDYLVQTTRAEEENKLDRAARLLRAYVLASPQDIDARVRYGELLEKWAEKLVHTPRAWRDALSVYEQVLKQAPERLEIRKRAAEIAVNINLTDDAENHLDKLLTDYPNDGRVWFLRGICYEKKQRLNQAQDAYKKSYDKEPKPEAFLRRAVVLRQIEKKGNEGDYKTVNIIDLKDEADKVMDALAQSLPGIYETHLTCAIYLNTYSTSGKVKLPHLLTPEQHLAKAREYAPDRPDVLIASAQLAMERADKENKQAESKPDILSKFWDEARGYLKHGLEKSPKDANLYLNLAYVETRAGHRDEAIIVLEKARKEVHRGGVKEVLFALVEQYAEMKDEKGTKETLEALEKIGEKARIDFVKGLSKVRQELWYEGSGILEHVRPLLATDLDKTVRIDLMLAECYGNMGDIDRQLLTYRRAVTASPLDVRARYGLARTLTALGRSSEAIDEYQHITQMERSPPEAWLARAELMVYQNLSRPDKEQRWDQISELLSSVKKATKGTKFEVDVSLLEAELLFAQSDKRRAAKDFLIARRDELPMEPKFWCALAVLTDREIDNKAALGILEEAVQKIGNDIELQLARVRLTASMSKEETIGVLKKIEADLPKDAEHRTRLLRALAAAYWLIDHPADAGRLWGQIALLRPNELYVRLLKFDVALKLEQEEGMQEALNEIKSIEGDGPLVKYGRASFLIWKAQPGTSRGDQSGLNEARNQLAAAASRRPGWSRIPLSLSEIDKLQENDENEIEHLKQAIELGERQFAVTQRVVRLLFEKDRYREADDILSRLHAQAPISNNLQQLAASASLPIDSTRALRLARGAVDDKSTNYREHLWLGQIESVAGELTNAEKEFEKAILFGAWLKLTDQTFSDLRKASVPEAVMLKIEPLKNKDLSRGDLVKEISKVLNPDETMQFLDKIVNHSLAGDKPDPPEPWVAYIQHLTRRERDQAKIDALIKRIEQKLGKAPLALAECYERAGKRPEAEAKYLAAEKADPNKQTVKAVAEFYQRTGQPTKAEPYLQKLYDLKEDLPWTRRNLALAIGLNSEASQEENAIKRKDEALKRYKKAIELLDENKGKETAEDLRTRAVIIATQPGSRKEVIELLEQAEKLRPPQPEHVFLLAKVYEAEGNWPKARDRMLQVIGLRKDNNTYVAAFAQSLIRRGSYEEAAIWIRKLVDTAPHENQTLALQVEILCRLGKAKDSIPVINKYFESKEGTPADPALRALVTADLFDRASWSGAGLEATNAAERSYIRFKELSKEAGAALPLASFYSRNDDIDNSLHLCEEAIKNNPLERVVLVALPALASPAAKETHFAKVEAWLVQALAKKPDSDDMRFLLGTLKDCQKRYSEAEAEYRKVLSHSAGHTGALNNLAFLLAMTGKAREALDITHSSTTSTFNLRETQAVAYMAAGDLTTAKRDLETVVADGGSAVAYYHLAVVRSMLKDKIGASSALRQAQLAGLRINMLHPMERPTYSQLIGELKP